ncbi:MAG: T9SS type A sorting domain-containing protein, partial [Chitinophagaceae bacterium]|nr:T9SS type A sorting domain-containing protein [Chitinophagaceae bacterium]
ELRIGGATGDGNSRVIFDDLSVSASAFYGPTYHCNPAATAVDDTDSLNTISVASGSVLANDQFPGDNETYTPTLITPPTVGTLVFNNNGTYSYTPPAGYTGGTITFTYSVTDNGYAPATSNIATVTIKYASLMMLAINNNRPTYSRNTNTNNNTENMEINIRQNPVSSTLQFAFTTLTKQQTLVSIYSMTGALVHQENKSSSKGKNMVNVNVQSLPKGMYVVMLSGWNVKEAAKFIKQ